MRVYWDDAQKELIALAAARLEIHTPGISFMKLIREAQEILPPECRRKIVAIQSIPWFREKVMWAHRQIQRESLNKLEVVEAEQPAEEPPHEVDEEAGVIVQAIANDIIKKLPDQLVDKLASRIADQILEKGLDTLVDRLGTKILSALGERLSGERLEAKTEPVIATPVVTQEEASVIPEKATPSSEPVHKTRILVVGLLPIQEHAVRKQFQDQFKLDFWKEEGIPKLKSMIRSHDHVVVLANKAGAPARLAIQGASKGGVKVHWVTGGESAMSRELLSLTK